MEVPALKSVILLLSLEVVVCQRILVDSTRSFQESALTTVNGMRVLHYADPLEVDDQLAEDAAKFALVLHQLAKSNKTRIKTFYAHPQGQGEAVYTHSRCKEPEAHNGELALMTWYCEIENHDFNQNGFFKGTAEFSQIVWKATKKIGLAKATNLDNNDVAIVARFAPEGNLIYKKIFEENVVEPMSYALTRECSLTNAHKE